MQGDGITNHLDIIDVLHLTNSEDSFVKRFIWHVLVPPSYPSPSSSPSSVFPNVISSSSPLPIRGPTPAATQACSRRSGAAAAPARLLDVVRVLVKLRVRVVVQRGRARVRAADGR